MPTCGTITIEGTTDGTDDGTDGTDDGTDGTNGGTDTGEPDLSASCGLPDSVTPGQSYNVTVEITNNGTAPGFGLLIVTVDGVEVVNEDSPLVDPGVTETVVKSLTAPDSETRVPVNVEISNVQKAGTSAARR